ncbi:MAG: hypothetical protein A2X64_04515 [Ignavibacteria bacterium GWF2_33_9]|nr:MAG: hypothetical protein A2X64_04515 [Ignavibacteria bacterium GWF2_33_9]
MRFRINISKIKLTFAMLILFSFPVTALTQNRLTTEDQRKLIEEELNENAPQDTTQFVMDTVGLTKPLKNHTRILLNDNSPYKFISKRDINYKSYYTFYEIFKSERIGYPLSLGFPGMNNSFSAVGNFSASSNLRLAGNSANDFETGIANLSIIPVEYFESAEIFLGSDAVIFGDNSTGTLVNIQEVNHNTYLPYTKLWYSQGPNELIAADGSYSQNFAKNFNLDLGFRSLNSPGRFTNQALHSWNLRAKFRWNPTDLTTISFSENYTDYGVGENGGNNPEKGNIYDLIESQPYFSAENSRLFRHNMQLNFSTFLDSTRHFGITSSNSFNYSMKEFKDGNNIFFGTIDSISYFEYDTYSFSNKTQIETDYKAVGLTAGEEISYNKILPNPFLKSDSYFNFALFAQAKMNLFDYVELSGGARYYNRFGNNALSVGAKIKINFDTAFYFFGDISKSDRLPSLMEGIVLNAEHHYLILAGLNMDAGKFSLELMGFIRQVDLPILFSRNYDSAAGNYRISFNNGSNMRILGIEANSNFNIEKLHFNFFVKTYFSQLNSQTENILPNLYSGLRSYYQINAGRSELHLGLEYEAIIGGGGMSYFPGYQANYYLQDAAGFMGNGLNLFVEGKLGEAYLKAAFNNALGQGYYFLPYYPELGSNFNFTFSWAFLD